MAGDPQVAMQDYLAEQLAAATRGMRLGSTVVDEGSFDVSEFTGELDVVETNQQVGTKLLFENDRVRIWEIDLAPGERVPFHFHSTTYFWVCVDGARAIGREADGTMHVFDHKAGDVDFLPLRDGEGLIHDLENNDDSRMRFVTVELLG
jgi:quercetin dioxygenase-like cupin family protein